MTLPCLIRLNDPPPQLPLCLQGGNPDEAGGVAFLQRYDVTASYLCNQFMEASWQYNTNITQYNKQLMVRAAGSTTPTSRSTTSNSWSKQFRWTKPMNAISIPTNNPSSEALI